MRSQFLTKRDTNVGKRVQAKAQPLVVHIIKELNNEKR